MSGVFGYSREAIRVKVKKCEGSLPPEMRKFSVDPQITSFEILQSILCKAFDLKGEFNICYRIYDSIGNEIYLPLLSDWDLDAAFLKAHNMSVISKSEPCLCLRVNLKSFEEDDDWEVREVLAPAPSKLSLNYDLKPSPRLQGLFNQVGKTLNMMQKAFNFGDEVQVQSQPPRMPLSDSEFRRYLDNVGQLVNAKELRTAIYFGGIDPSLRKVVWKHLLNVYPKGMTGRERMDYIKMKATEYVKLKETWKVAVAHGPVVGELAYTTGMVRKDVLRTDRHHQFYAGSDDNENIAALFNILTTYALNHPKVSYCQGMSDLASPLLVTMSDEAHAYICFCALMQRLCTNFMIDGIAMTQKFSHLAEGIMHYDPEFYNYLKVHQADDLLFCYRWLLLEMKREFAFEDSLRMLEVLWSSLPADPPDVELKLFDVPFQAPAILPPPTSPQANGPRENAYTKICALRRQSSTISLSAVKKNIVAVKRQNHSLDETIGITKNILETKPKHQSLDDSVLVNKSILIKSPKSPKTIVHKTELSPLPPKSPTLRPRSVSPLEPNSDSVILNNRINNHKMLNKSKSASLSSSMTNIIKNTKRTGHFKDFKEKFFASLDQLDNDSFQENDNKTSGRMVKNLNEFLNFAAINKNRISDKLMRLGSSGDNERPKILLTKSSFDDSESSSGDRNTSSQSKPRFSSTSNSWDDTFDDYSPDDSQEYFPLTTSATRELKLELENLDRKVFGNHFNEELLDSPSECNTDIKTETNKTDTISKDDSEMESEEKKNFDEVDGPRYDDVFIWENPLHQTSPKVGKPNADFSRTPENDSSNIADVPCIVNEISAAKTITPIKVLSNHLKQELPISKKEELPEVNQNGGEPSQGIKLNNDNMLLVNGVNMTNSCEEVTEIIKNSSLLPPPHEFGGGNPFLMFLCLTVLLQHRDQIIGKCMDYNEMAMHFDKMVRKHNVVSVLNQARQMYAMYVKQHNIAYHRREHEDC